MSWQNRAHFFGIAAQTMRRSLVDHARARLAEKRGGGDPVFSLDEAIDISDHRVNQLVALDEALKTLADVDPQKSRVVELKYFGGMTLEETAESIAFLNIAPNIQTLLITIAGLAPVFDSLVS